MIGLFFKWATDWLMPSPLQPVATRWIDVKNDGRTFAWVRARGKRKADGTGDPQAQIIYIMGIGPKLEVVASRALLPSEYKLTLEELIKKYPAPEVTI